VRAISVSGGGFSFPRPMPRRPFAAFMPDSCHGLSIIWAGLGSERERQVLISELMGALTED
jgi:hypothetical protein